MREVVFLVTGDALHSEALHIMRRAVLAVAINDVIGGTSVILMEHIDMNHLLPHKELRLQFDHGVFAILVEHDDIVHVGAVAHVFIGILVLLTLQAFTCANEAFVPVDIELLVVGGHGHGGDVVEVANLGLATATFAIFLLDV